MDWLFSILTVVFIVVSIALVLIILVQRPQGGGLAAAFGGGGGSDTAFGGRTGDALTVATVTVFTLYLAVAIGLNIMDNSSPASDEPVPEEEVIEPGLLPAEGGASADTAAPAAAPAGPAAAPAPTLPADPNAGLIPIPKSSLTDTKPSEPAAPSADPAPAPVPAPAPAPSEPAPGGI